MIKLIIFTSVLHYKASSSAKFTRILEMLIQEYSIGNTLFCRAKPKGSIYLLYK